VRALLLLYFASGLGAVAVETVWMRWLRDLLGATAPAASATLVAFLAGHAAGAAWMLRRAARTERPLALYGRLELVAAAGALAVPLLLALGERAIGAVYDAVRDTPTALTALRFSIALLATFPAAFCFGATFPAIARAATRGARDLGARGGALYAVNTLGAAAGTAAAVAWLPASIGVRATHAVAVACLVLAGGGALWIAHRGGPRIAAASETLPVATSAPAPTRAERRRAEKQARRAGGPAAAPALPALRPVARPLGPRGFAILAGLSGFGVFALQVLLVQSFAQVSNQSVYAFGAVLVTVLLAIAAGGGGIAVLERRGVDARGVLGAALVVAALALASFPAWLERITGRFDYVGAAGGGGAYFAALLGTAIVAAGPALLAAAFVFPAVFAIAGRHEPDAARGADAILGRLIVANTTGAIGGALAAPYLLLPLAGLWPSFAVLSLLYGFAAIAVPGTGLRGRIGRDLALVVGWLAVVSQANPLAVPPVALAAGERVLALESTPAGVVAVIERDGQRLIRVDNHYALGGTAEQVHQERQAHLPLVLAPHARSIAYAGSATGISAGGALAHPIESLTVVELIPGVARAAERWFGDANRGVYADPRTQVVLDDARNFLRWTQQRFDVVVADLFVPWQAGAGALYTREHFEAVRARLLPGGLFCQWLPLYQLGEPELRAITATFRDVFPHTGLFRGDFFGRFPIAALVGWADAPAAPEAIEAAAKRLAEAGVGDRWVTDPMGPWALYVGPVAEQPVDVPRNHTDRPVVERLAAATHEGGSVGKRDPVVGARWLAFTESVLAREERLWPGLSEDARRSATGGGALQLAGTLYVGGEIDAAARAFTRAASLLPSRLVADASADPTAAELWHAE
jgi:spermidine synthase